MPKKPKKVRGNPVFRVRLPQQVVADLAKFAKMYGSPSPSAFARELLQVVTSGDLEQLGRFNGRLMDAMARQVPLPLDIAPKPPDPRPTRPPRRGRV